MYLSSSLIVGGIYFPSLRTLIFIGLMMMPNCERPDENWLNSFCTLQILGIVSCECSIISKKQISYSYIFPFRFAFRRAGFNVRTSDLACRLTPIVEKQKARFNIREKKTSKRVGARRICFLHFSCSCRTKKII